MFLESMGCDAVSLLDVMRRRQDRTLHLLKDLVELESPSHDKAAGDACVDGVERECAILSGRLRRHPRKAFGDLLEVRFGRGGHGGKPIMLLGHLDTVWELGTLS